MDLDLSIIIVNYNTREMTQNCLNSIIKRTHGLNYEIILIDNGSQDSSIGYFREFSQKQMGHFPPVRLIENTVNLGFSKANNQGIRAARGESILLLNSDTIAEDNSIFEAHKLLKENQIITIKIIGKDGKNQQAGGYGPTIFNLFCWATFFDDLPVIKNHLHPYQVSDTSFFENDRQIDWVMGAFMMFKKALAMKLNGLDENLFMYGEEMEFCHRARKHGVMINYHAKPHIIHFGCGSSESGEAAIVGEYQALKYFFMKHGANWQKLLTLPILKLSSGLRFIIFAILNQPKKNFYAKAFSSI